MRNRLTERDLSRIVKRVINEEDKKDDNKEDKMGGNGTSITLKDIFEEVVDTLKELGDYDDSMKSKAMKLAKKIMSNMQDDLAYISENYEEDISEILGDY